MFRGEGGAAIKLTTIAARVDKTARLMTAIAYCFAAGAVSIGLGVAAGSLFTGAWRTVTAVIVGLVSAVGLGEAMDWRRRKRLARVREDILDGLILHYEGCQLRTDQLIEEVQEYLGDDIRQQGVVNLVRSAGRMEGAIAAFHSVAGPDCDLAVLGQLIDVIAARILDATAAAMPFAPAEVDEEE